MVHAISATGSAKHSHGVLPRPGRDSASASTARGCRRYAAGPLRLLSIATRVRSSAARRWHARPRRSAVPAIKGRFAASRRRAARPDPQIGDPAVLDPARRQLDRQRQATMAKSPGRRATSWKATAAAAAHRHLDAHDQLVGRERRRVHAREEIRRRCGSDARPRVEAHHDGVETDHAGRQLGRRIGQRPGCPRACPPMRTPRAGDMGQRLGQQGCCLPNRRGAQHVVSRAAATTISRRPRHPISPGGDGIDVDQQTWLAMAQVEHRYEGSVLRPAHRIAVGQQLRARRPVRPGAHSRSAPAL